MHADKPTNDNGLAGGWAVGMAVAAGLIRLLPHPWHFTPVGALGLFGGARLARRGPLFCPSASWL